MVSRFWSASYLRLDRPSQGEGMRSRRTILTGPAVARLGERWALVVGMACELTALVILGVATQGWILFALAPLFALGGIGMPALQSFTTTQVDADKQGQLQGVLASLVSLAAVFGPLFFSFAKNSAAAGLDQISRWPSCDHNHAGRASCACCSTRRAFGDLVQSAFIDSVLRPFPIVPDRHNFREFFKCSSLSRRWKRIQPTARIPPVQSLSWLNARS